MEEVEVKEGGEGERQVVKEDGRGVIKKEGEVVVENDRKR